MELLKFILMSLPMTSSITCGRLFVVAYQQQLTRAEQQAKKIVSLYFISMSFVWLFGQLYMPFENILRYFIPVLCFILQVTQVFFYHFIYVLTPLKKENPLYIKIHYIIPILLFLVSGIFMGTFIYLQQLSNSTISSFFRPYVYFSTLFFMLFYTVQECRRIILYRRKMINIYGIEKWKPMRWIELIMVLRIMFITLFFINELEFEYEYIFIILIVLVPAQHIIIVYKMLMRSYMILSFNEKHITVVAGGGIMTVSEKEPDETKMDQQNYRQDGIPLLTRAELEHYYKTHKPYLNSDFKINDLAEYFKINRTYLSAFINRTFHTNFSQYNNLWRLNEMEYLKKLPEHRGKNIQDVAEMAGFGNPRTYWRVKKMAESVEEQKNKN